MSNANNEAIATEGLFISSNYENQEPDILMMHMDIREPLSKLKNLLEQKVGIDLKNYKIWLQDAQILEPHKNLVDQCVEGKGVVQINVQIHMTSRIINIVDVLKPTEQALEHLSKEAIFQEVKSNYNLKSKNSEKDDDSDNETSYDEEHALKWVLDNNCQFKKDQAKLKIPDDPNKWTVQQVHHWLLWAVREFNMTKIKLSDWNITGEELCNMSLKEFEKKVPSDPGNIFRTHFELLRKCKFVAVIQKQKDKNVFDEDPSVPPKKAKLDEKLSSKPDETSPTTLGWENGRRTHQTPLTGQVHLWQFLLDILTDYEYKQIIQWISADGEFRLIDPDQVAKLWGERKNKPLMNYEKLSRALRYYYDGDMISKVHGKRFVYKFVCNLKQLIGYDAADLARLVNQCS